jgi:Tol biopolymer transport system component
VTRERRSRVVSVAAGLAGAALVAMSGATAQAAAVPADGSSYTQSVSADGRFVAFASNASNLVPGDTNDTSDVFVRDRQTSRTTLVSVSSSGAHANDASVTPSISANGRFVVFTSKATNLTPRSPYVDLQGGPEVYVRDLEAGTTELVSVSGKHAEPMDASSGGVISADGRIVAFTSATSRTSLGDIQATDVFVRDLVAGTTERVSLGSGGAMANGSSSAPRLSADGRFVVFSSSASNLVAGDANNKGDVFLRDRVAGTTQLVDVSSSGEQADNGGEQPSISGDGRYIAFVSAATNLVPGGTGGTGVFVRDEVAGVTERIDIGSSGGAADGAGDSPEISADGRFVAFISSATNLVSGASDACPGTGACFKIYVRDRLTSTTDRASVNSAGDPITVLNGFAGGPPALSADGSIVVFSSDAAGLDGHGRVDELGIYLRNRASGMTELVSVAQPVAPPPPSGRRAPLVVYETLGYQLVAVHADGSGRHVIGHRLMGQPSLAPDGRRIAFTDWNAESVSVANLDGSGGNLGDFSLSTKLDYYALERPRWSPDGHSIAFEAYNVSEGIGYDIDYADLWVARDDGSPPRRLLKDDAAGAGDGSLARQLGSAWSWSPNGRLIASEWPVNDKVSENIQNVEIVDVRTGRTRVLTRGREPAWSPDGRHLVFFGPAGLAVIGLDGRGLRILVHMGGWSDDVAVDPSWSPDGKTIAYWTLDGKLEAVDAAGLTTPRRLFRVGGNQTTPLWARDSRSLLVTSDESGVWVVPVTPGSRPKRLAKHAYEAVWRG